MNSVNLKQYGTTYAVFPGENLVSMQCYLDSLLVVELLDALDLDTAALPYCLPLWLANIIDKKLYIIQ